MLNTIVRDITHSFSQFGYDVHFSDVIIHERQPGTPNHTTAIVMEGAFGVKHHDHDAWFNFIAQMAVTYKDDTNRTTTLLSVHVTNSNGDPMIPCTTNKEAYCPEEPDTMESICFNLAKICLAQTEGTPYNSEEHPQI